MSKRKKNKKTKYEITFVKKGEVRKLPLVHVQWRDHAVSGTDSNWNSITNIGVKALTCHTVGYQVAEDKEAIALAQNVAENGSCGEIMTILKSCIVEKVKL